MECFMRAAKVSKYNMRMMVETTRIPFIFTITIFYVMEIISSVALFSSAVQIDVTPFAFVFVVNNYKVQFVIAASVAVLFCNAPFEENTYSYMVSRAGKFSWGLGQVIYILEVSFLYICSLVAATLFPLIGHIKWCNEWGKIWGTLGKTDAGTNYHVNLSVSENIIREYEPIQALIISILLEFCCIVMIGLIIYLGNKITSRAVGTVIGAFIAVLDICVSNDWASWAYGASPVSLVQLDLFYGYAAKWGINQSYSVKFFIIGIVILGVLCVAANYKDKLINKMRRRHSYEK